MKNIKDISDGEANSIKGLLLPRICLTDMNSLKDIIPEESMRPDADTHEGLLVYNLNEDVCALSTPIRKGLYIWYKTQWLSLSKIQEEDVRVYTDQDGNTFRACTFGSLGTWMVENLRATKLADNLGGTPLNESAAGDLLSLFAYTYPKLDKSKFDANPSIGLLYDWEGATNNKSRGLSDEDLENFVEKGDSVQGICPEGWYLPTIAEWIEMEQEIIRNFKEYSSKEELNEPDGGLKSTDPFNGNIKLDSYSKYKREGTHGLAMPTPCNYPKITTVNDFTGNSLYDGGFSILYSGGVYQVLSSVGENYGKSAMFRTSSLTNVGNSNNNLNCNDVIIAYTAEESSTLNARAASSTNNGGYLSVRCKKK